MRVATVGAGINGIMCAWALAEAGHAVTLFERGEPMGETSSRSSKLLHGGLRYLEHGQLALVREGLRERAWWLRSAPQLTRVLEIIVPVFRNSARSRPALKLGLLIYDLFAGRDRLGWHRWLNVAALGARAPELRREGLIGGYRYFDGQMDDRALGLWALHEAQARGVELRERTAVARVDTEGGVFVAGRRERFDFVVNAAGPWAGKLLAASAIASRHTLDLVRGSHLIVGREVGQGYLLQSPDDGRVCFVLPYQGRTLIGTTEVRQSLDEPITVSTAERDYLLRVFNAYLRPALQAADVVEAFAGVRPLLGSRGQPPSAVSREYALERSGRLLTVFGGKWTTARALGRKVARTVGQAAA
ncbi:MAG TPA: glycerol-3-phosphate dehydrogenase/oxidase [Burkholderiales bacterium]|jgi:glycerol-3-phosphate dehydrogenase|nr:glycerol-3-phosphate dehydrogenase/oxidase [Burkholderiales bacterium]